ncbi:hypothetical protein [Methylocella sp.]|uniref:hypothetical protein n=1 Tax=Methylocella sp. TaxID=1978226 RepID=UPI003782DFE5
MAQPGSTAQPKTATSANAPARPDAEKPLNLLHLSTLVAVAVLVGTEMVGASWAAGWAIGGLLQLDPWIGRAFEIVFTLIGFVLLYFFMRIAIRHEPIRG